MKEERVERASLGPNTNMNERGHHWLIVVVEKVYV